jgi:hypothetical protein
MKAFKIQMMLGNEAMQTPADVAEALAVVANTVRTRAYTWPKTWPKDLAGQPQAIKDRNGNTVGQWEVR